MRYREWYHLGVADIDDLVQAMRNNATNVAFKDLLKVCVHHFGEPRHHGGSHHIFKMPWAGEPRVNIQAVKGKAKPYQVRQVLKAIDYKEAQ